MKRFSGLIVVFLLISGLIGCSRDEEAKKVSLEKKEALKKVEKTLPEDPLRIAVGGMITPREGFVYYRNLLDYIGKKLGRPIKLVDRENYAEINNLLKTGDLDVAFVCSGPYVEGHDEFGLEILVAPQAYGRTEYYSYIIVHTDSSIKKFEDLKGKSFAFTDPKSNTGKSVPTYMLLRIKETPGTFFKKYVFTYGHDKSIKAVAQKLVDGAAVDSLIWDYDNKVNPEFTSKTKIILKSPPYGIPPVVFRKGLDVELKKKLREIFLNIHKDDKGKEIIKKMMIDKFVVVDDSAYNSIREMRDWIAKQDRKK